MHVFFLLFYARVCFGRQSSRSAGCQPENAKLVENPLLPGRPTATCRRRFHASCAPPPHAGAWAATHMEKGWLVGWLGGWVAPTAALHRHPPSSCSLHQPPPSPPSPTWPWPAPPRAPGILLRPGRPGGRPAAGVQHPGVAGAAGAWWQAEWRGQELACAWHRQELSPSPSPLCVAHREARTWKGGLCCDPKRVHTPPPPDRPPPDKKRWQNGALASGRKASTRDSRYSAL